MTMQLVFSYETGNGGKDYPYWQDFVIAESKTGINVERLEGSIKSYTESDASEGKEYSEMTGEIMNASGYNWHFLNSDPVSISRTYTFLI